jgi:hypothetical protein
MTRPYPHLEIQRHGDVFCVRLRSHRLEEPEIYELANELIALCTQEGCRKLALSLGPHSPECIYSVFLAKLITVQRVLGENGGKLILCDVGQPVRAIFEACRLDSHFVFLDNFTAAIDYWVRLDGSPPG